MFVFTTTAKALRNGAGNDPLIGFALGILLIVSLIGLFVIIKEGRK